MCPPILLTARKLLTPTSVTRAPRYEVSPLIFRLGLPTKSDATSASPLLQHKLPCWDTVIDGGAFDGSDFSVPAFRLGYAVYTFELVNHKRVLATFASAGLVAGTDYSIIDVVPGVVPAFERKPVGVPHIYFFKAGVSDANSSVFVEQELELAQISVSGGGGTARGTRLPVLRLDAVVPGDARIALLKLDVQGHEPQALDGARGLLSGRGGCRIHSLFLEWWPQGIVNQGSRDGGVGALTSLYDYGTRCYDLGVHREPQSPFSYNRYDRPSLLADWTKYLLDVREDTIGGWDELYCELHSDPFS